MKKRIIKKLIEVTHSPSLYRYNVEFSDGSSIGSCYCYKSYKEAEKAMEQTLKWAK